MFGDQSNNYTYVNITSVGTFAIKAENANEKRFGLTPTKRIYKTKSGEEKDIYEFSTTELPGTLLKVKIRHTDFGDNITINLKSKYKTETHFFSISASTDSSYGRQLMERLPGLKPGDNIKLNIWDEFTNKEGKTIRAGIKITNLDTGETINSFFWDKDNKMPLHDYPAMKPNMDDDDWKIFFATASKVVKTYIKQHVEPLYASNNEETDLDSLQDEFETIEDPFVELEDDDLPF